MRSGIRWIAAALGMLSIWAGAQTANAARDINPAEMVILVEPTAAMDAQREKLKSEGRLSDANMPIYRPLVGDLVEVLAINHPEKMEIPQLWMFANIFKDGEEKTWDMALQNTGRLTQPVSTETQRDGMVVVTCPLGFVTSVLLEDQIWSAPELQGSGDIVVMVDSRGLIVSHTRNRKQMSELKRVVADGIDDPNLVAKTLLVRRDGHWEAYP
jgi:hypothetical protein